MSVAIVPLDRANWSEDAIRKHKKSYVDDDDGQADERSLGSAAAMQALKMFNQGETGSKQSKGAFLGLAMSEASKVRRSIPTTMNALV